MQNLYYEWVFPERRRLTQAYLVALQELAVYYLAMQEPKRAIDCMEKAISLDQLNEDLYCLAMKANAEIGDRASVARAYSNLQKLLRDELNTKPLPETTSLYQELMNRD
jgi:DNA-binding SARP family transcriptional activator